MAIKYVREDFRERAKGIRRDLLPVDQAAPVFPKIRWTRLQVLSLLAVICALLILDGLQKKRQSEREHVSVVESLVTDKWTESLNVNAGTRYFVELTMPYGGDEEATVVAECHVDVWNALNEGTPVSVSFFTAPRDGMLVIRSIAPIPSGEEAGASRESGARGNV